MIIAGMIVFVSPAVNKNSIKIKIGIEDRQKRRKLVNGRFNEEANEKTLAMEASRSRIICGLYQNFFFYRQTTRETRGTRDGDRAPST